VGAVLVHIDLDGERPHASSLAALTAGRAIASSWGATLYAALIVYDPSTERAPDSTAQMMTTQKIPRLEKIQSLIARAGADKVIVAVSDAAVAPLWTAIGVPWQGVLDHLRPRLVLFGADAPSSTELAPRTGARIGARLLHRARATGGDQVELRDRDGGYVRAADGGAAVATIGANRVKLVGDDDIDVVMLVFPGAADARIELVGTSQADLAHALGPIIAIGDDAAATPRRLAPRSASRSSSAHRSSAARRRSARARSRRRT
jgi:hypothetical protein